MLSKKIMPLALLLIAFIGLSSFVYTEYSHEQKVVQVDTEKKFAKFLKLFPEAPLPYQQDFSFLKGFFEYAEQGDPVFDEESPYAPTGKVIKYEYKDLAPYMFQGGFSRMGPDKHYAEQVIAKKGDMVALLYSTVPPYGGNKNYEIITFDRKGNFIATKQVGSLGSYSDKQLIFEIDEALNILCHHYEREGDGEELKLTAQQTEAFQINPHTGEIVAQAAQQQENNSVEDMWNY